MTYIPGAFSRNEKRIDRVPVSFGILLPTGEMLTDFLLVSHVNPLTLLRNANQLRQK